MFRLRRLPRALCRALLLAACATGAVRTAAAQETATATSGDPRVIAEIRARYAEIEREAPGLRRTTRELQGFSLEGGELEGFYRGGELRKLRARHYGETGRATDEYYFSAGRLVFAYVVDERYDEPLSGRVRVRTEHRYYFDGGRLVRLVRSQHPPTDEDLSPLDREPAELVKTAGIFAACAAASGSEPPECTAPES